MREKIIAYHNNHLRQLIEQELIRNGSQCDLNHIDVSNVTDMDSLFSYSRFNGDISKWNVSNVKSMNNMFRASRFNGDISKWNVSNVKHMHGMFKESSFNNDISPWNVHNVINMKEMFYCSKFNGNICNWKPYQLRSIDGIFNECPAPIPYWSRFFDIDARKKAIESYELSNALSKELNDNNNKIKKIKI
jgi:hypothetical protein